MATDGLTIQTITVLDDIELQHKIAIEVEVTLFDGSRRWCFFCNNKAMDNFGDWIPETQIPFHNAPHMFVVGGMLSVKMIETILRDSELKGDLGSRTLKCD